MSNDVKIELDNENLKQFKSTMHNNTTEHTFVDFYKDNTCAITQDTITGNAVTLNSTSTYSAEGIFAFIHIIKDESVKDPLTRMNIKQVRYNSSYSVFSHSAFTHNPMNANHGSQKDETPTYEKTPLHYPEIT